jgi:hypothetical protein
VVIVPVAELEQKLPTGHVAHSVLTDVLQLLLVIWPDAHTVQVCGALPPPRQNELLGHAM